MRSMLKAKQAHPIGAKLDTPIHGAGRLPEGTYQAEIVDVEFVSGGRIQITWQDTLSEDTHIDSVYPESSFEPGKLTAEARRYRAGLLPDLRCQEIFDSHPELSWLNLCGLEAEISIEWSEGWRMYREGKQYWAIDRAGVPITQPMKHPNAVQKAMEGSHRARLKIVEITGSLDNIDKFVRKADVYTHKKDKSLA